MLKLAIASLAVMASAVLADSSVGHAHVINECKYPIYVNNTPAAGGGHEEINRVVRPHKHYSQKYTQLDNRQGWSIKLAMNATLENILQYEYTFHDDGVIWYDASAVDGNPWDGNYMITATGENCNPKQQAYRFSTDDAFGMQDCPQSSNITITLCSGEDQAADSAESASQSAAAKTKHSHPEPSGPWWGAVNNNVQAAAESTPSPTPTTFATMATPVAANGDYDVTVTEIATEVVTNIVMMTEPAARKRHEHHPRHPHHHI